MITIILLIGTLFGAVSYYLANDNKIVDNQSGTKQIKSIELSEDKKAVLNAETKEIIFTIDEANKYLKDSNIEYAGNCFEEASLKISAYDRIVFSTGCLSEDTEEAWIGIYNFPYKYKTDLEQLTKIYFLIGGSGKNFIWLDNGYYMTYEADLKLDGLTEIKKIDIYGKIIETKNDISDWKTYKNDEYGFEFNVPYNWEIEVAEESSFVTIKSPDYVVNEEPFNKLLQGAEISLDISKLFKGIEFFNINNIKDLQKFNKLGRGREPFINERIIKIEEEDALLYDYENINGYILDFLHNGLQIKISIRYDKKIDGQEIFNQILSTFRFIEKDKETFSCGTFTIKDIDGNIYNTVKIGEQCWMKENLKVTKNPEGEKITRYCYDNDESICETDGGLYDWNTAMNGSTEESAQGICPEGWHVPGSSEWYVLISYLKDDEEACNNSGAHDCASVKTKLLSEGHSGFDAIYSGYLATDELFKERGSKSYFWSSSDVYDQVSWKVKAKKNHAWARFLEASLPNVYNLGGFKTNSFPIRCLKN